LASAQDELASKPSTNAEDIMTICKLADRLIC
jgi:hypothetical protein